jgi:hypothetical protein
MKRIVLESVCFSFYHFLNYFSEDPKTKSPQN